MRGDGCITIGFCGAWRPFLGFGLGLELGRVVATAVILFLVITAMFHLRRGTFVGVTVVVPLTLGEGLFRLPLGFPLS